jgi:hypothetical protein
MVRSILAALAVVLTLASCDVEFDAGSPPSPITPGSTVAPLIEWQDQRDALNIVFVPDGSYGDLSVQANLQAFFDDIETVIEDGYWQNNAYYVNLGRFNYYYMTASGTAAAPTGTAICPTVTWPAEVDTDAAFADLVLLLHANQLRDCRWGRKATSEPTSSRTVVHESTHALFNIPDEYCCDGGYYTAPPVLYSSSNSCKSDGANAAWRNCASFTANSGTSWWRSEDTTTDIMSGGGSVVLEAGQGDWAIMDSVLGAFGPTGTPSVFAPNTWDGPQP